MTPFVLFRRKLSSRMHDLLIGHRSVPPFTDSLHPPVWRTGFILHHRDPEATLHIDDTVETLPREEYRGPLTGFNSRDQNDRDRADYRTRRHRRQDPEEQRETECYNSEYALDGPDHRPSFPPIQLPGQVGEAIVNCACRNLRGRQSGTSWKAATSCKSNSVAHHACVSFSEFLVPYGPVRTPSGGLVEAPGSDISLQNPQDSGL